ncbi:RPA-interacting protein B-like [Limulus polyphemus]|uniref:RPA-interacting protein B-like n=1 Tax=Limulus polyphemus TaxID=6850 RepID=A0ABM1SW76_LIMPO|nr:RPA-interacting protein B-like [Limulus polyphemus]
MRCFEGLTKRRQKLLDQFRQLPQIDDSKDNCFDSYHGRLDGLVEEVIKEEWDVFKGSWRKLPSQLSEDQKSEVLEETDEVTSTWKQIQEELVMEGKHRRICNRLRVKTCVSKVLPKILDQEQNFLQKIEKGETEECRFELLQRDEVICPVCQRSPLAQAGSVIFCPCGIQIDTEQDSFTLHNFHQQLDKGITQHTNNCNVSPIFSVRSEYGITNLLITCTACGFMFIVV